MIRRSEAQPMIEVPDFSSTFCFQRAVSTPTEAAVCTVREAPGQGWAQNQLVLFFGTPNEIKGCYLFFIKIKTGNKTNPPLDNLLNEISTFEHQLVAWQVENFLKKYDFVNSIPMDFFRPVKMKDVDLPKERFTSAMES